MNQLDIVGQMFRELQKAIDNAKYDFEVEKALYNLKDELIQLGVSVN